MSNRKILFVITSVFLLFCRMNSGQASMIAVVLGQTYTAWIQAQAKQAAKECPLYKDLDQKGKFQIGSAYNLNVQKNIGLHLLPIEKSILEKVYENKVAAEARLKANGEINLRPNQSVSVVDYLPRFNFFEYCNCMQGEIVNSISEAQFNSKGTDGLKAKMIHSDRCLIREAKR